MIRTIAAALAAVVFIAFSAIAAEETPLNTDAARKETAKERKAQKKAAKKAKKAKKKEAAPADTSATPK